MDHRIAILFLGVALWSGRARAELEPSPQRFALEGKIGPYLPHIDNSTGLSGATPFSDLFGDPNSPKGASPSYGLLGGIEFDYQFLHRLGGSWAVGLQVELYRKSGQQPAYFGTNNSAAPPLQLCKITAGSTPGSPRNYVLPTGVVLSSSQTPMQACLSSDVNTLNIVPLTLLAIYRFDYLALHTKLPLIPYLKAGLAYFIWWNQSSASFVTHIEVDGKGNYLSNGPAVQGASFGLQLMPGIALDLGIIDRDAARVLDQETGINRVSLFAELNYAWVNGFSRPNKLDLGDITMNGGLAFEF